MITDNCSKFLIIIRNILYFALNFLQGWIDNYNGPSGLFIAVSFQYFNNRAVSTISTCH